MKLTLRILSISIIELYNVLVDNRHYKLAIIGVVVFMSDQKAKEKFGRFACIVIIYWFEIKKRSK